MEHAQFDRPEVQAFAALLSSAMRPSDVEAAKRVLVEDLYGISAMVSFPFSEPYCYSFPVPLTLQKYVVPYLSYPHVYFISHEPLIRPLTITYMVMFDTNFASYVDKFVRGEPLGQQQEEVRQIIHELLYNNVNFESSFYMVENLKKARPIAIAMNEDEAKSPRKFWDLLDEGLRQNIISLRLFNNVDCSIYKRTGTLKYVIDRDEATDKSIEFAHWTYVSEGQELIDDFLFRQKAILFQLLLMLKVQFSSKRGPRNKIREFLDYVQEAGVYFEREAILAHKYFKNRSAIPILAEVNRGGVQKSLFQKIDKLAWDMTAPRYMERMIAGRSPADFIVPFFLSFDEKLRNMIGHYRVKAVIIDRRSATAVLPVPAPTSNEYFTREGCGDIIGSFSLKQKREERKSREIPTLEILSDTTDQLYEELSTILRK